MNKNLMLVLPVALVFGVIGAYFGWKKHEPETPADTAAATFYAQQLPDLQGKPQPLDQWKGKHLIVNFWATWCAPCVEEMPELSAMHAEVAPRNIHVVGIGIDSPSNMAEFAMKHKIAYPLYVAGMGGTELSRRFGNPSGGLPFTILLGADGKVRKTYLGKLKFDELRRDLVLFQ